MKLKITAIWGGRMGRGSNYTPREIIKYHIHPTAGIYPELRRTYNSRRDFADRTLPVRCQRFEPGSMYQKKPKTKTTPR